MSKNSLNLDRILKELGPFGRYNILNYSLLLFPIYLSGLFGSVYIFEAPDLSYRCAVPECEGSWNPHWIKYAIPETKKGVPSKCERYESVIGPRSNGTCTKDSFTKSKFPCHTFVYSDEDSAVRDFDLGCQDWKRTLVGTIHNAGLFISLPLTGYMSDRYGRKKALAVASLMNGICGFTRSFSVNYYMMISLEFLEAALGAGAYSTAFIIAIELVGPKGRVLGNTIVNTVFICGLMSLAGLAWLFQDWRTLLRVIYSPAVLCFSYIWILNESVRWLISKGKHKEALEIIQKAAKMNKVELSDELLSPLHELEKPSAENKDVAETAAETEKPKSPLLQAFKSSIIRKRVFVCSFLWVTCTFVYYGLSINSVSLAGNKYLNFILVAFVELPANLTCLMVLDKFGRKRTLIVTYFCSACLCMGLSMIPKAHNWWSLVVYLSGKYSITVAYSSVYIYVSEVFPTSVRQSLLAVCSSTGRIGSTLAPLTPLLALYFENLPALFFGGLALIACGMVFTLPETINVALPDTIEEAENISNTSRPQTSSPLKV